MADKHPYISGTGAIVQLFDQLKKSLPPMLNAEILKKLSIASSNESYAMNIVRFLGLIDDSGKPTTEAAKIFTLHNEESFKLRSVELLKRHTTNSFHYAVRMHGLYL